MNIDTPQAAKSYEDSGPGDYESIKELRNYYSFCANPIGIKCQSVADKMPYTMSLDYGVTCDLNYGLKCLNSDQGGFDCGDYEVSVNCDCGREYYGFFFLGNLEKNAQVVWVFSAFFLLRETTFVTFTKGNNFCDFLFASLDV